MQMSMKMSYRAFLFEIIIIDDDEALEYLMKLRTSSQNLFYLISKCISRR